MMMRWDALQCCVSIYYLGDTDVYLAARRHHQRPPSPLQEFCSPLDSIDPLSFFHSSFYGAFSREPYIFQQLQARHVETTKHRTRIDDSLLFPVITKTPLTLTTTITLAYHKTSRIDIKHSSVLHVARHPSPNCAACVWPSAQVITITQADGIDWLVMT